jgi:hypothetical protein
MTVIPAGTEVAFRITYLEMPNNPGLRPPGMPDGVRLEHAVEPPVWFFLSMYDAVGRDYEWRDRFVQAEEDPAALAAFVSDPLVEMWVAYGRGWPQGFFMLDWREDGVCDLAYFGLVPEAVGGGLGGRLLRAALAKGWARAGVAEDDGEHLHARPSPRAGLLQEDGLPSRPIPRTARVSSAGTATRPDTRPERSQHVRNAPAPRTGQDPAPYGHVRGRSPARQGGPRRRRLPLARGGDADHDGGENGRAADLGNAETKSYVGILGDPAYLEAMRGLILATSCRPARVAACATPGGTGAVRQVLEMTRWLSPEATVWISDPTWPNHPAILRHLSQKHATYRYYDRETGGIDRDGMFADLAQAKAGDLILLHACCHNPTGADLAPGDWQEIAGICDRTGAIPFVDMAYLGFAESLEEDAAGTRHLAATLPEVFIAASCSKNFGLYRERAGVVLIVTGEAQAAGCGGRDAVGVQPAELHLPARSRRAGGGDDPERSGPAGRMARRVARDAADDARQPRRTGRGASGRDRVGPVRVSRCEPGHVLADRGGPEQVALLRETHGIYVVGDGRMNVAGLTPGTIPRVAKALAEVLA